MRVPLARSPCRAYVASVPCGSASRFRARCCHNSPHVKCASPYACTLCADPLNNALLAAWGLLRGGLGMRLTLSEGLQRTTPPAPELEGAVYTFGFLGANVCVTVTQGVLVNC